jgi:hypothetical protein
MFHDIEKIGNVVPKPLRDAVEAIFSQDRTADLQAAADFAAALGIKEEFSHASQALQRAKDDPAAEDFRNYLYHFQNNLDLLISKTWVEKHDQMRKERLSDRIPTFIGLIENGHFAKALTEFGEILEELAFLFFGAQSEKDDFIEYTTRIDIEMGMFWWYAIQIRTRDIVANANDKTDLICAILLVGICYLTNF